MAIWQYSFYILPKAVSSFTQEQLTTIFDEGQEVEQYWNDAGLLRSDFNELSQIFASQKSWCATIDQYGSIDSSCIEVSYEKNNITNVHFRINFTSDFEATLLAVMAFCRKHDLIILGEWYRKLPVDIEGIKQVIFSSSNAAVYATLSKPNKPE